jgi:2'-5' RNA ligase
MRSFFALWPDDDVRRQLSAAAEMLPDRLGRRVPPAKLHLTLVFLGNISPETRAQLEAGAGEIRVRPFSLQLERSGWWSGARVAWLAPQEAPQELYDLVKALRALSEACHVEPEGRSYRPHLTIARKVMRRPRPLRFEPIRWQINSFCLVESQPGNDGSEYRVVREWSLS